MACVGRLIEDVHFHVLFVTGIYYASKVSRMDLDRVYRELDWFSEHKVEFIFCCDANFGMLPRDYEIAKKAAENKKYGYPHVLSVQNTEILDRAYKVQKLLAETGLSKGVTLAMQSVDPHTKINKER